jgi:hypothetical protein
VRRDPSAFVIPVDLWQRETMSAALAERDFGVIFKLVQKYAGASQTGLSMRTGIPQSEVSLIIAGNKRVTSLERAVRVASGLGMPDGARMTLGLAPLRLPEAPGGLSVEPVGVLLGEPPADERGVLTMAAQRAKKFTMLAGQAGTTAEVIDQIREDVRRLAQEYPQRPLGDLLGELAEIQDVVFSLLEQRQRPTQARELSFLGGVVGGMLAKASHDFAEPGAAMTQARTAFLCAENADHNGLRAWLRGLQSLVAYWAGRAQEAVRYARSGAEYASVAGNTTTVWLAMNEARAAARLGDASTVHTALAAAESAWDQVRTDDLDEFGGLCTFSHTRHLYYAADTLCWLPNAATKAARYAEQAVAAYSDTRSRDWAFGDQAGSHSNLAIARILGNDLEGAQEALAPVLRLPTEQRINGIIHSVQRVHRSLSTASLINDASDLREEIEAFTCTPMAALTR